MKYVIPTLGILALLASCGEATKTVSEFRADEDARIATLETCRDNPAEWDTTPNCGNAEAATREMIQDVHQAAADEAKPLQDQIVALSKKCLSVPVLQRKSCNEANHQASQVAHTKTKEIADRSNARKRELSAQIARN